MQEACPPLCQAFTCLGLMLTYIYGLMVAGYSALVVRLGTYVEPCLASCIYSGYYRFDPEGFDEDCVKLGGQESICIVLYPHIQAKDHNSQAL
ncbi:hypothetical protein VNO77_04121 [Canavalia gladiata]|uniref:Uncharacterized protein n=1 Tax=Canavalia gladiata TaxID=3824 RepID=A0AAN9MW29_CANGL